MKNTKYILGSLGLAILTMVSMTHCGGSQQNSINSSQQDSTQEAESNSETSIKMDITEQVSVDIEDIPHYDLKQDKIQISPIDISLQKVQTDVFPQDESKQTMNSPEKGVEQLSTEQGLLITHSEGDWSGSTKEWETYGDFLDFRTAEGIVMDNPVSTELEFMSRKEAENKIMSLIKNVGMDFEPSEIKIESYTKEYLTELVDKIKADSLY